MQLHLRPFYNDLRQQNKFEWTIEHGKRYDEMKTILTKQISSTILNPVQTLYAMGHASNFGIGEALLLS